MWLNRVSFFAEARSRSAGLLLAISVFLSLARVASAGEISVKKLPLSFHGKTHLMDLYRSGGGATPRPGVVLIPDYWGKDELDEVQAKRLAELGYAVLVVDLYGGGAHVKTDAEAAKHVAELETPDLSNAVDLVAKATSLLEAEPGVDAKRVALVGFGYGGGLAWNLGRKGADPAIKSIVSFYGGTKSEESAAASADKLPAFLYVRPGEDVYTTAEELSDFSKELKGTGISFEIYHLDKAAHGFIHQGIEKYGSDAGNSFMTYDAASADRAWKKVGTFLESEFKPKHVPVSVPARLAPTH